MTPNSDLEGKVLHSSLASIIILSVIALTLVGCVFFAGSPHDNFKVQLQSKMGKQIDKIPPYSFPNEMKLIDSQNLPNGNIENKYIHQRTCMYFIEIDPKTRTIVGVHFEGKESDCVINP